jgi:DNA-binding transcriptional regulator GbsR (MarR family)
MRVWITVSEIYNEYKMSPTSISGGGKLLTGGELISPASLKGQEEVLPTAKLEQWPYKGRGILCRIQHL